MIFSVISDRMLANLNTLCSKDRPWHGAYNTSHFLLRHLFEFIYTFIYSWRYMCLTPYPIPSYSYSHFYCATLVWIVWFFLLKEYIDCWRFRGHGRRHHRAAYQHYSLTKRVSRDIRTGTGGPSGESTQIREDSTEKRGGATEKRYISDQRGPRG